MSDKILIVTMAALGIGLAILTLSGVSPGLAKGIA
mgnify:CR=1 FL=1